MSETLANALGLVLAAFVAALTPALVVLAQRVGAYFASLAKLRLSEQQERELQRAVERGVAAAEEFARRELERRLVKGPEKLAYAKETARSLAPAALAKLDEAQLDDVVSATVAKLRPSMSSLNVSSLLPPQASPSLPTRLVTPSQVEALEADIIPRAPRVPTGIERAVPRDEADTTPAKPSALRGKT